MRRLRLFTAAVAAVVVLVVPAISGAEPTVDPNRIFPDPIQTTDFIQYTEGGRTGISYKPGLAALEERYGKVIDVDDIGDLVGMPGIKSFGGRDIPVITVTDESVPNEDKVDLYFSMSIHGLERAGLEGSMRFIEDIASGWYREDSGGAAYTLSNGDPAGEHYRQMTAKQVLEEARLVFVDLNPDGWAAGDRTNAPAQYQRGNGNNSLDLNRQWPTLGWSPSGRQYNTLSEPESQAGYKLIEDHLGVPEGAADLHGELGDDVILAIMFPAGQFDPRGLTQQVSLAEAIKYNVNNSVFPGAKGALSALGQQVQPAEYHTAYDAIGYDDGGFQGDYLVQQGILEMDHEYLLSHQVPSNVFSPIHEQIHVDTTRELLKATIVTTIQAEEIEYEAELEGAVAYVHNPEVLTEAGAQVPPPHDLPQKPYESTSMQYYADLAKYTDKPLTPLTSDVVAAGQGLDTYDTIVVTDRDLPRYEAADGSLQEPDRAAFWANLKAFAEGGGNLVLTDRAVQGLVDMGVVAPGSVERVMQDAGKVTEIDRDHALLDGITGVIGQTYFEVPLGYAFNGDRSPAWGVDPDAWEGAGGSTAAFLGSTQQDAIAASIKVEVPGTGTHVGLGTAPVGDGQVTIFGAILPDATQAFPHAHGLADYAVTYAGNEMLVNAMTYER